MGSPALKNKVTLLIKNYRSGQNDWWKNFNAAFI
jgi:hypothetical protein